MLGKGASVNFSVSLGLAVELRGERVIVVIRDYGSYRRSFRKKKKFIIHSTTQWRGQKGELDGRGNNDE